MPTARVDAVDHVLLFQKNMFCAFRSQASILIQMDTVFCALEQLDPQQILQFLHGAGQGWLGQMQLFRSRRQGAAVRYCA